MAHELSGKDLVAIREVAASLGVNASSLLALIRFETGGTFEPKIKNPSSSARGLIQFMDLTAKSLGYNDSLDLVNQNPTFEGQLRGPVKKFLQARLKGFKAPIGDQKLFMAVFYPAYMEAPTNKAFPDSVQRANPGIKTPGDYIQKLYAKSGLKGKKETAFGFFALLAAGAFFLYKFWKAPK
jgi:hypothetical protein